MNLKHSSPFDAAFEGNTEILLNTELSKIDITGQDSFQNGSIKKETTPRTVKKEISMEEREKGIETEKTKEERKTALTNHKTTTAPYKDEAGSEIQSMDSSKNKGKGISPFLESNIEEFKPESNTKEQFEITNSTNTIPDGIKPVKSALLKRDVFSKIKKQKSVVFNKYAKVVEVENWKKYNVDMYKELMKEETKKSFCTLF